ncbi:hypothetical protein SCHPADRAFT_826158 [Schizopora paradoxa]|uniref:F-box domain-containing protein n=1 Tax=Schizopora paradoxa TaxID=27342 RepID=A0A0H2RSF4_9AGAM|nr:hypothetical protein SCHPADRAFT_826158 [Schizopora paradoxa]
MPPYPPPRNQIASGSTGSSGSSFTRTHARSTSDAPAMPLELFYQVFENLSPSSLSSVARTSSAFNGVTERMLYRRLELNSSAQAIQCFQTLVKKPSSWTSVQECVIMISDAKNNAAQFQPILASALRLLTRLTSLHLAVEGPFVTVLDGCNFPSLKTFSSIVDLCPWAPMANFLYRHPSITHFCIGGEVPGQHFALPPGTLPNLQTFMGSRRLVSTFVPNRPVSRATLAWHSPNLETEVNSVIPSLSMSSVPLTTFSCATPGWSSTLVRSIAAYLPELKSIRLLNVSVDYHNEAELYSTLADVLSSFTDLSKLEIPCSRQIQSILTLEEEAGRAKTWHALAPRLAQIVFPSGHLWENISGRWTRVAQ